MLTLLTLPTLLGLLGPQRPQPLHCRIELAADAKSERCRVEAPAGRTIRPCADADRRAGHCAESGGARGRFVAWVVSTGPGRCRITDKGTKWKRGAVTAKLSGGGPSTCNLYVELR